MVYHQSMWWVRHYAILTLERFTWSCSMSLNSTVRHKMTRIPFHPSGSKVLMKNHSMCMQPEFPVTTLILENLTVTLTVTLTVLHDETQRYRVQVPDPPLHTRERDRDRESDRQTYRQTYRQTDRQTDRQGLGLRMKPKTGSVETARSAAVSSPW